MITLLTYLSWPKHVTFQGLSEKTLRLIEEHIKGPNYKLTASIDIAIILIVTVIVCYKIWKED